MNSLGGQRVGLGRTLAGSTVNEFRRPEGGTNVTVWVDGCMFEIQGTTEGLATITDTVTEKGYEVAWCLLPVSGGKIPARAANGVRAPVAVSDITAAWWLEFGGQRFMVQSRASLEYDDQGREDHVFCIAKRRVG